MTFQVEPRELAARIVAGEALALARGATLVERGGEAAEALLATVHAHSLGAQRIGITGPPGAGKSTLSAQLTTLWRARGLRVGLVAVDPSSAHLGGAVLGDRVRLPREVALDPEVFFRSLASRGALGGLATAAAGVADLVAAWGADRVLIETVGVGQSEIDILSAADTTLLVLQPQTGDSVQALKAGILEIADIVVIHKADLPGAESLGQEVEAAIHQRLMVSPGDIPVVLASSQGAPGLADLAKAIDAHQKWLDMEPQPGLGSWRAARRRRQLAQRIHQLATALLTAPLHTDDARAQAESLAVAASLGTLSPAAAARQLVAKLSSLTRQRD